jgi:membrane-associated phospholipid phosphatase
MKKDIREKVARVISEMFNGFLTLMLPSVLATFLSDLSLVKKIFLISLIILGVLIPYFVLRKMGKVTDHDITDRKQRPLFFSFVLLSFLLVYLYVFIFTFEYTLLKVVLATEIVFLVLTVVTLFWKMSGHMTTLMLSIFSLYFLFGEWYILLLLIVVIPVGWSRIVLKKHDIYQVIVATIVSSLLSVLILFVL